LFAFAIDRDRSPKYGNFELCALPRRRERDALRLIIAVQIDISHRPSVRLDVKYEIPRIMAILAILTTIFKGDGRQGCHKGAHQVHRSRCSDIDTCSRYNDPARQYSNLPTPAPEGAGAELMPRQRIKFYWEARREIWATARSVSTLRGFLPPSQSPHPPPAPVVLYTPRYIRPNGLAQSKFSALQARRCYIGVVVVVVVGGGRER